MKTNLRIYLWQIVPCGLRIYMCL